MALSARTVTLQTHVAGRARPDVVVVRTRQTQRAILYAVHWISAREKRVRTTHVDHTGAPLTWWRAKELLDEAQARGIPAWTEAHLA